MKNKSLALFLVTMILLSLGSSVQAANQDVVVKQVINPTIPSRRGAQVQDQIKTQNQGEDPDLMVKTNENTDLENTDLENTDLEYADDAKYGEENESSPSEIAKEKMSDIAAQVEGLLNNKTMKGGIGEQVKAIATQQRMAQEQVRSHLDRVENRKGLLKSLIGPDFKALKNMEDQVGENQLRIKQLMELKAQFTNEADVAVIETVIQDLTVQNTQLEETVVKESQSKSLLGWLFKHFTK